MIYHRSLLLIAATSCCIVAFANAGDLRIRRLQTVAPTSECPLPGEGACAAIFDPVVCGDDECEYSSECLAILAGFPPDECTKPEDTAVVDSVTVVPTEAIEFELEDQEVPEDGATMTPIEEEVEMEIDEDAEDVVTTMVPSDAVEFELEDGGEVEEDDDAQVEDAGVDEDDALVEEAVLSEEVTILQAATAGPVEGEVTTTGTEGEDADVETMAPSEEGEPLMDTGGDMTEDEEDATTIGLDVGPTVTEAPAEDEEVVVVETEPAPMNENMTGTDVGDGTVVTEPAGDEVPPAPEVDLNESCDPDTLASDDNGAAILRCEVLCLFASCCWNPDNPTQCPEKENCAAYLVPCGTNLLAALAELDQEPEPEEDEDEDTSTAVEAQENPIPLADADCSEETPCGRCEGDCNSDSDCDVGLKCFRRTGNDDRAVPGCQGTGVPGRDYCYVPGVNDLIVLESQCSSNEPCQACEGDCDVDADCTGDLRCYATRRGEPSGIPGCNGEVSDGLDFCYQPEQCGPNFCDADEYCCNRSCGICAPVDGGCTAEACNECGPNTCLPGQVCCNESCGICAGPDDFCTQQECTAVERSGSPFSRFLRRSGEPLGKYFLA